MKLRKILCPTDFSEGSARALEEAVRLSKEHGAELVVTHAWYLPPTAVEYTMWPEAFDAIRDDAGRGLDEAVTRARGLGATNVTGVLLEGVPWTRIVQAAEGIDLIVIGTHGRTGLSHVLLGSVAEKVIRHAHCSVLVVPAGCPLRTFKRVVCPVDFSEASKLALQRATELVAADGTLTVVHVIELPVAYRGQIPLDFAGEVDRQSRSTLDAWVADAAGKTKATVVPVVRIGTAGAQVLHLMAQEPCDLVVAGSHGRTGIKRALLGSVAEKLARHAGCPVFVAR
jgi:nucleotide-binding universal stress UspA family protein